MSPLDTRLEQFNPILSAWAMDDTVNLADIDARRESLSAKVVMRYQSLDLGC